jgi:hypothetical protein
MNKKNILRLIKLLIFITVFVTTIVMAVGHFKEFLSYRMFSDFDYEDTSSTSLQLANLHYTQALLSIDFGVTIALLAISIVNVFFKQNLLKVNLIRIAISLAFTNAFLILNRFLPYTGFFYNMTLSMINHFMLFILAASNMFLTVIGAGALRKKIQSELTNNSQILDI